MKITPGVTIEGGDSVNRQTLYDLWALGAPGSISQSDLAADALAGNVLASSTPTSVRPPGQLWFDQTQQLLKCWIDVMNDTGVSVWLSIGPDRIDDAFVATEPIPRGAMIALDSTVAGPRHVRRAKWNDRQVLGVNNTGDTAASGSWFSATIFGFTEVWWKSYLTTESAETIYYPAPGSANANQLSPPQAMFVDKFLDGAVLFTSSGVGAYQSLPEPRMCLGTGAEYFTNVSTNVSLNYRYPLALFTGSSPCDGWEKFWNKSPNPFEP